MMEILMVVLMVNEMVVWMVENLDYKEVAKWVDALEIQMVDKKVVSTV
jgi:hypothetical protein